MEDFGQLLFKIRRKEKLTQKEMAAKIGISQPRYNRYELGKTIKVSIDLVNKFYNTFIDDFTPDELKLLEKLINNKEVVALSTRKYQKYHKDDEISNFLLKFKHNHALNQIYISEKLGIDSTVYNRYETGNKKITNPNFIIKFREMFKNILTIYELEMLDKYYNNLNLPPKPKVDNKIKYVDSKIVAEFLKQFRQLHKVKETEVAEKLQMKTATYFFYETGKRQKIKMDFIIKFRDTYINDLTEQELKILNDLILEVDSEKLVSEIKNNSDKIALSIPLSEFLKQFRINHNLSIRITALRLGISYHTYYRYEYRDSKFLDKKFFINFYNTFKNILTKEELEIVKNYLNNDYYKIENLDIRLSEIVKSVRERNSISLVKMNESLKLPINYIGNVENREKHFSTVNLKKFYDRYQDLLTLEEKEHIYNYLSYYNSQFADKVNEDIKIMKK